MMKKVARRMVNVLVMMVYSGGGMEGADGVGDGGRGRAGGGDGVCRGKKGEEEDNKTGR